MRDGGRATHVATPHLSSSVEEPEHLTSAQMLRRHAQDLIEAAERLLAQAEAELETAYSMVSGTASFGRAAGDSRS